MGVICQILLQKTDEGIHRPGQPVRGVIKYAIDIETEYKCITLSFIGKGQCQWTETETETLTNNDNSTTTRTKSTTYVGNDKYIDRKINILQKPDGITSIVPAGCYEYPFEFILPKDIPPSFKDYTCTISYEIIFELVKPRLINSTKKFDTELNVYGYVKPTIPFPIIFGAQKSLFKLFSLRRNIINLKVELAKTILTPGENAHLSYVVTNQSTVEVKCVKIELLSKNTYTADCGRTNFDSKVFQECTVRERGCEPDSIAKGKVVLPTLGELYTIQHTKVMSKQYFVRVTLELPLMHVNESAEVEVVIGEVDPGNDLPPPYCDESKIKVMDN